MTTDSSGTKAPAAVDCHAHVMRMDAALVAHRHSAPAREVDVAEYIQLLDRHGMSHGVLTAPSFYGTDNSLLLSALAAHPRRLRGTAIVDPGIDPAQLEAMDAAGVVGIRLNWVRRAGLPDVAGPDYQRLFARVRELDWHVEIYLEGVLLPVVLPHVRRSGAKVVLDHFGSPDPAQGVKSEGFRHMLDAVEAGDTWVKLSAPYRLGGADPQPYVDALLRAGGPQRLVWASDWPWVQHENDNLTYQGCLDWLGAWVSDEKTRRVILGETALELFRF